MDIEEGYNRGRPARRYDDYDDPRRASEREDEMYRRRLMKQERKFRESLDGTRLFCLVVRSYRMISLTVAPWQTDSTLAAARASSVP